MAGQAGGRTARRAGLAMAFVLMMAACTPIVRNHGYAPSDADLSLLTVGVDTRDTVAETVGRPAAQGLLNDEGWFYVQSRFEHVGPRQPREVDRQVVAITFDQNGTVANIERFGLAEGRVVPLSRRVTESNIKGFSFIRQLLSGIGRFNIGDFID